MVDQPSAIARLERLHSQIASLQTKPSLGGDFYQWYLEVINALETIFGADSNAVREFQQIPFEVDPEILRRIREQFALPDDAEIPQDPYYQERLYEAEEFLLAMLLDLKSRGNNPSR
jgi:hypothetical protein